MSPTNDNDDDKLYFFIVKVDSEQQQYIVSSDPAQRNEAEEGLEFHRNRQNCKPDEAILIELYMPKEEFIKMCDEQETTYLDEDAKNEIIRKNNQYKPFASLTEIAANKITSALIKDPNTNVYQRDKISDEVYDRVVKSLGDFLRTANSSEKKNIKTAIEHVEKGNKNYKKNLK